MDAESRSDLSAEVEQLLAQGYWASVIERARENLEHDLCPRPECGQAADYGVTCGSEACIIWWSIELDDAWRAYLVECRRQHHGRERERFIASLEARRWWGWDRFGQMAAGFVAAAVIAWPILLWLAGAGVRR